MGNLFICNKGKNSPQYIGTYSGNQNINVSRFIKNGDTVNNFMLELVGMPFNYSGLFSTGSERYSIANKEIKITKQLSGANLIIKNACLPIGLATNVGYQPVSNMIYTNISYKVWYF